MKTFIIAALLATTQVALSVPNDQEAQALSFSKESVGRSNGQENIGRDIVGLYEQAVAATEKVCDDYRRIKAMQLAKQRDIDFTEAYEYIQSVMPVLKPIDKELLRRNIRDPSDLKEHEHEVNKVKKEIEIMIELTTKLLLEIEKVQQEIAAHHEEREVKLEEIVQKEKFTPEELENMKKMEQGVERKEQMKLLAERAKESETEKAKDLTPFMPVPKVDIRDLTAEDREKDKPVIPFKSKKSAAGTGFRIDPENIALARRFRADGLPVEWMFIDTWYTIGPFPNPMRLNLKKKFPPETVVDLDATYIGKNGRRIKWEFRQSRQPRVVPANPEEYGIWYAYTEIYMDRPAELWLAMGSDDKSNVWLNDMPVWISGDKLKGWKMDEGFRKVRFNAGRNRILYRVENGHIGVAFSLGIRVAE